MNHEFHPAANEFPKMDDKRLSELTEDIKANGLRVPITLFEDQILDGRNRYVACEKAGIEPHFETFDGDPWGYVWSLNGARRDLVADQRYLIWKECHEKSQTWKDKQQEIKDEGNRKRSESAKEQPEELDLFGEESSGTSCPTTEVAHKTKAAKAKASNTNMGAVSRGDKLAKDRPDLAEKVRKGETTMATASREMKKDEHAERLKEAPPQPTDGNAFGLVLADPPWRYDHQEAENRAIENQYPTATLEEIKSHKPKTEKDAILFMWATAPKLKEALDVLEAWGFDYKTHAIWDKQIIGMGYWFRGQHELLLVGTKGKPGTTPECERVSSIFSEKRTKHSKKPLCVYEWIEKAFPDKSKLEMYGREKRDNWQVWGNES